LHSQILVVYGQYTNNSVFIGCVICDKASLSVVDMTWQLLERFPLI